MVLDNQLYFSHFLPYGTNSIFLSKRAHCLGLLFYNELSHIFYRLRISDYKNAVKHVDKLDAAIKQDTNNMSQLHELTLELNALNQSLSRSDIPSREWSALSVRHARLQGQLTSMNTATISSTSAGNGSLEPTYFGNTRRALQDKLLLAPPPINGEWLPKSAVYALVDLIFIIFSRPKGNFKECDKRIQSGMHIIEGLFLKLEPHSFSFFLFSFKICLFYGAFYY